MRFSSISALVTLVCFAACTDNYIESNNNSSSTNTPTWESNWTISTQEVYDGGVGKDGIPAIDDPQLVNENGPGLDYLKEQDLVLGIRSGDTYHAYPHPILDWHEIINTEIEGKPLAVTYCPLTGTGIGWNRELNGTVTTFGVSGLLYNNNLMPYDRETESLWSQVLKSSVQGELAGSYLINEKLLETSWETWKLISPNTLVLSSETGYSQNYDTYPYGIYKTSEGLLFPVSNFDQRLFAKERVLGLNHNGEFKVYRFESFVEPGLINDNIRGRNLMVIGNKERNFMVAFFKTDQNGNTITSTFEYVPDSLPVIMQDDLGNQWDIFGQAISGPNTGDRLASVNGLMGYWFSLAAFFPDAKIYDYQ